MSEKLSFDSSSPAARRPVACGKGGEDDNRCRCSRLTQPRKAGSGQTGKTRREPPGDQLTVRLSITSMTSTGTSITSCAVECPRQSCPQSPTRGSPVVRSTSFIAAASESRNFIVAASERILSHSKQPRFTAISLQQCAPKFEIVEPDHVPRPEDHFYPGVIDAEMHPVARELLHMDKAAVVAIYCDSHPEADRELLKTLLDTPSKWYRWAGGDLIRSYDMQGQEKMVIIEMNSCPSGNKSVPFVNWGFEGFRRVIRSTVVNHLNDESLPPGALAVLFDVYKQKKESYAYATMLANLTNEKVYLVDTGYAPKMPSHMRWTSDGVCQLQVADGQWQDIRALFRYVTRRPWLKLPVLTKTMVVNPVIACLAGGRNKLLAAKAYQQFNDKYAAAGLIINVPTTMTNVSRKDIRRLAEEMNHQLVVKVPYSNCGVGVFTITNRDELEHFYAMPHSYDKYIVQSLISHCSWPHSNSADQLYHVGCRPAADPTNRYVVDLRFMICSDRLAGWMPVAMYSRRAAKPLCARLEGDSWEVLGTNLSMGADGTEGTDTNRLILMDSKTFPDLNMGLREMVEGYVQTVMAAVAIDNLCCQLMPSRDSFDIPLLLTLDEDRAFVTEIADGCTNDPTFACRIAKTCADILGRQQKTAKTDEDGDGAGAGSHISANGRSVPPKAAGGHGVKEQQQKEEQDDDGQKRKKGVAADAGDDLLLPAPSPAVLSEG